MCVDKKQCKMCGESKLISAFPLSKVTSDGLQNWCTGCRKETITNCGGTKNAEYKRTWRLMHLEEDLLVMTKYRDSHKEEIAKSKKQNYIQNIERIKKRSSEYLRQHKDKVRMWSKKYRETHKAEQYEYQKKRHTEDPSIGTRASEVRRTRKMGIAASLSKYEWTIIKNTFGNVCCYCGEEAKLEQDHFIPLVLGGEYTINNIVPSCASCNRSKNTKLFKDWYPEQSAYSIEREKTIYKFLNYKNGIQQLAVAIYE